MATRIRHKRSAVAGNQPSVAQLDSGELAINTADGKVYLLRDDNTVQDITKRIFENNTEVRVDDLADSASAEISMTVNGDEKMTVTNAGFNMKDDIDLEDFGKITFRESIASGEDGIGIQAPFNLPNSYDLTLPLVNGTVGQILKTDGFGNLAFSDPDIFGGNVIYVSAEQGNDANDGQSAPVKTIKRACKLASAIVYNPDGTVKAEFDPMRNFIMLDAANPSATGTYLDRTKGYSIPQTSSGYEPDFFYKTGGRVGFEEGGTNFMKWLKANYGLEVKELDMDQYSKLSREYNNENSDPYETGRKKNAGGGIMSMPMGQPRVNQGGVTELDYRAKGGFVPVGIKEKADDVPAMLSKNEFVFTADAVRGAGNGSIEKGAQKMYDTMKNLERRVT